MNPIPKTVSICGWQLPSDFGVILNGSDSDVIGILGFSALQV
jgi:hypothetical protein